MARRHKSIHLVLTVVTTAALACSGTTPEPVEPTEPDGNIEPAPPEQVDVLDISPRALLSTASFGAIVRLARSLEEQGVGDSESNCVLHAPRARGGGYRLEADVAIAVQPLPDPPVDLDTRLQASPASVRVLTRWGPFGSGDMLLAAVTGAPPPAHASVLALFLTDEGVYLRNGGGPMPSQAGPIPTGAVASAIAPAVGPHTLLFVTAEDGINIGALRALLAQLPQQGPSVALAVPLAVDTVLPQEVLDASIPQDTPDGRCPDGLADLAADAPVGSLDAGPVRQAFVSALIPAIQTCLSNAFGRTQYGPMNVQIRIDHQGVVSDACIIDAPPMTRPMTNCTLQALRALTFPTPDPAGYVDVIAPLLLEPMSHQPLCD